MYEPKLGRFQSRDPAPANGVELLHPFPDMTRYAYARNNPVNRVDPSGFDPVAGGGICKVELRCVHLGLWVVGPLHCGLTVTDSKGTTLFHVLGGTDPNANCAIYNQEAHFGWGGSYWTDTQWTFENEWACRCIRNTAALINSQAANLPYQAIPTQVCGDARPVCNSNYVTKCLLEHCGMKGSWVINPVGWGHRMKKCVKWHNEYSTHGTGDVEKCKCVCDQTETIDDAWCSPAPNPV